MREDLAKREVLARCEALKAASFWCPEPKLRPRAWLDNFAPSDQQFAGRLLEKFNFYGAGLTDALMIAAFNSISDGLPKGPAAPKREALIKSLDSAVFTPVRGEQPNPTDSGYLLCRKARQLLRVPESHVAETASALEHAKKGGTVVFLDDFIGSGDQFLHTWREDLVGSGDSFKTIQNDSNFTAIYITLVSTDFGLVNINREAPTVAVCPTHVIENKSTVFEVLGKDADTLAKLDEFLTKYSSRLLPSDPWMAKNVDWLKYGYKRRGLLLGFEHSIPDATLPIFWAPGTNSWEPLIERN
jgi:hypothetical protein